MWQRQWFLLNLQGQWGPAIGDSPPSARVGDSSARVGDSSARVGDSSGIIR